MVVKIETRFEFIFLKRVTFRQAQKFKIEFLFLPILGSGKNIISNYDKAKLSNLRSRNDVNIFLLKFSVTSDFIKVKYISACVPKKTVFVLNSNPVGVEPFIKR